MQKYLVCDVPRVFQTFREIGFEGFIQTGCSMLILITTSRVSNVVAFLIHTIAFGFAKKGGVGGFNTLYRFVGQLFEICFKWLEYFRNGLSERLHVITTFFSDLTLAKPSIYIF